ncbi:MAG: hypothetical protein WD067_10960 [Gaiellaceae bacterium]
MTRGGCSPERLRELIELNVVGVLLCGIGPRVTHQRLQRHEVTAAFPKEAIREAVSKLMRREAPHAGPLAHPPHHAHERLIARRLFRVLAPPLAIVGRHPLLDLDSEDVIVEFGLLLPEAGAELVDDVRIEWKPVPVLAFAMHADAPTDEVEVRPAAASDFGSPEACALHEHERRPLVGESGLPKSRELVEARPVDVGLALRRPSDLPRWVEFDQVLRLRPAEERVQHRNHVRARRRAPVAPMLCEEGAQVARRQRVELRLRVCLRELPEDAPIRVD